MIRLLRITALILAGEMIYALPFHTQRFFRPTLLEAFDVSNTQLGDMFAAYGITAMFSYLAGGPFADRYSTRALISISLVLTAAGGLYMATFPEVWAMSTLYAYWGITTSFLFWAALIKATREWGGESSQATAFGILDGGRGLAAAMFAAGGVSILVFYLPEQASLVTDEARREALRSIILYYTALTLGCAGIIWYLLPHDSLTVSVRRNPFIELPSIIRRPLIWAQAGVIICAYCCYKGLDNYALYAVQALNMSEIDGSKLATYGAYIRPVACIIAGLVADRHDTARSILALFAISLVAYSVLSFATTDNVSLYVIYFNMVVTFFAAFAFRGIYYALLEETRTPRQITGASVAVIAFVGYTPEIFFGPVTGRILDANPGVVGHLNFFKFLFAVAAVGIVVTLALIRFNRQSIEHVQPA